MLTVEININLVQKQKISYDNYVKDHNSYIKQFYTY